MYVIYVFFGYFWGQYIVESLSCFYLLLIMVRCDTSGVVLLLRRTMYMYIYMLYIICTILERFHFLDVDIVSMASMHYMIENYRVL